MNEPQTEPLNPPQSDTLTHPPGAHATLSSGVTWRSDMAFDATVDGFVAPLDAGPEAGGTGHGPRPKALVLTALAGCTAMDVVAILRKSRVALDGLSVTAQGTLGASHPKVFSEIVLRYDFQGASLPLDKLERAVHLSLDKYCGVAAMLRPTAHIRHIIHVNGAPRLAVDERSVSFVPNAD